MMRAIKKMTHQKRNIFAMVKKKLRMSVKANLVTGNCTS